MHQIAITTKHTNFAENLALAYQFGVGLEIQSFAFPPYLNTETWRDLVPMYQKLLADFPYPISLHGMFMDMAPGSPDPYFQHVTYERTLQSLELAQALSADYVVFHANFIATIKEDAYRDGWIDRMVSFFGRVVEAAQSFNVHLVLENMWEFDPSLIRVVLDKVQAPNLSACLDVGHAYLYSQLPFGDWLEDLYHWASYIHINNHYGDFDQHLGLDDGIIDYPQILPKITTLPNVQQIVLEVEETADMERSLALEWLPLKG